jgi:hypothetical protein
MHMTLSSEIDESLDDEKYFDRRGRFLMNQ